MVRRVCARVHPGHTRPDVELSIRGAIYYKTERNKKRDSRGQKSAGALPKLDLYSAKARYRVYRQQSTVYEI